MNVISRTLRRRVGQRARRSFLHLVTLVVALGVTFPAMLTDDGRLRRPAGSHRERRHPEGAALL